MQRTPELLLAIKRDVDRARRPGRFLLTGSANLLMMQRVSESLAGRAVYLTLWPMSQGDLEGRATAGPWSRWLAADDAAQAMADVGPCDAPSIWQDRVRAGGFPVAALGDDPVAREQWIDGYVRTYLERDLQDLAATSSLPGALLENLVLAQLLAWLEAQVPRPEMHYWRTHSGQEVDFVIEAGSRLLPIEVKNARRFRTSDAAGLSAFLDEYPDQAPFGVVLHDGPECLRLAERILSVPVTVLRAG